MKPLLNAYDMRITVLCAFAYFILTATLADVWSSLHFIDEARRGRVTCLRSSGLSVLGWIPCTTPV